MTVRNHKALLALVSGRQAMPFAWGTHDCVTFANDCAVAQMDRDVLAELGVTPTWTHILEAQGAIDAMGGLATGLDKVLQPIPVSTAQRGDIVLIRGPHGQGLGVMLAETIVGPGIKGLLHLPRKEALLAWSIG